MIKKDHIAVLTDEFLSGTDMFRVKVSVGQQNKINVYIDGDSGVGIDNCVALSRFIESHLDRDKEDFELNVSSAGIGEPLLLARQYKNKLNKTVEILLNEGNKFKAVLLDIDGDEIKIAREVKSKQKKKGSKLVTGEPETIALKDVKYTKELINI
jgi:ribosome maturation factor RimP